jgi:aryl-alcohol dehydrogenase-like predicted oxidoreductase
VQPLLDVLREVAAAHDAKPAQIALAWLLGLPRVVVIPGASSVEQMEFNAAAADLRLAADEQAALTAAARAFTPVSGVRTLVDGVRERVDAVRERLGV